MCTLCIRCRALDMLTGIRSSDQSDRHCIISSQSVSEVSVEFPNFLQFSLVRLAAARASCVLHVTPIILESPQPNHQPNPTPGLNIHTNSFATHFQFLSFCPRFKAHIDCYSHLSAPAPWRPAAARRGWRCAPWCPWPRPVSALAAHFSSCSPYCSSSLCSRHYAGPRSIKPVKAKYLSMVNLF